MGWWMEWGRWGTGGDQPSVYEWMYVQLFLLLFFLLFLNLHWPIPDYKMFVKILAGLTKLYLAFFSGSQSNFLQGSSLGLGTRKFMTEPSSVKCDMFLFGCCRYERRGGDASGDTCRAPTQLWQQHTGQQSPFVVFNYMWLKKKCFSTSYPLQEIWSPYWVKHLNSKSSANHCYQCV